MADPHTLLTRRIEDDWLLGCDRREFLRQVEKAQQAIEGWRSQAAPQTLPTIFLAHRDPLLFLSHFLAACTVPCRIALCNPDWGSAEWRDGWQHLKPDLIWGQVAGAAMADSQNSAPCPALSLVSPPLSPSGSSLTTEILIPSGGSSGHLRFIRHTWDTLMASVEGFQQYFQVNRVNSLCVLPLFHVSGLMQFLRSFSSGGNLLVLPFKTLEAGALPAIAPDEFFLSLVPTQLHRLLHASAPGGSAPLSPWLSQFRTILLGGAPAWPQLLDESRRWGIALAPTYGMTETASQVATLKPEEFLAGQTGCGRVLPHARITIRGPGGESLAANQMGAITIQANSLAWDYQPEFQTDDLGYVDDRGYLHVVGRQGDKLISGGENVFPGEVEAAIRATGRVRDVSVVGVDDRQWGQAITAIYVPYAPGFPVAELRASLEGRLSRFKHPKHWIEVASLPRNAQGKLNREQVQALLPQDFPSGPASE